MKEYSNLAEINTETIPDSVISDLASPPLNTFLKF